MLARTQQRARQHARHVGEQQGSALHRIEPDHAARLQVGEHAQEHRVFDGALVAHLHLAPVGLYHLHADHAVLNGLGRDDGARQRVACSPVVSGDGFDAFGNLGQGQALVLNAGQQRFQGGAIKDGVALNAELAHHKRRGVGHGGLRVRADSGQRRGPRSGALQRLGGHGLQQAARVGYVLCGSAQQRKCQHKGSWQTCGRRRVRRAISAHRHGWAQVCI